MWQIVSVPRTSRRINGLYLALLVRGAVVLACALFDVLVAYIQLLQDKPADPARAVFPALLLLAVAALASLPLPSTVPSYIPLLAETVAASVVIGTSGESQLALMPYLAIPIFRAGSQRGIIPALGCASAAAVVTLASLASSNNSNLSDLTVQTAWFAFFFSIGLLATSLRRMREATEAEPEVAYADAHRLLSELHIVARQLSLGLDPQTLATALSDDLGAVTRNATTTVLARSPKGRFVPLVGVEPPSIAEAAMHDAWLSAQPVRRQDANRSFVVIPVLMGERVVALVVLSTPQPIDGEALDRCLEIIAQSGPRLASAMLFEDVRRLATDDERKRVAREIHDGIAQDMASVGYALDGIAADSPPDIADQVVKVRQNLRGMVADLRMSIFDLRTGVDDTVSIGTALSEYAQRSGAQSETVVHFSVDESTRRLPVATEIELLRIAQEAITNVRRHARAKNLWIAVVVDAPRARITVADDGRGLQRGRPDSIGMTGMSERAKRIGAELRITSNPGAGTVVEITVAGGPAGKHRISAVPKTVTLPDTEPIPVIASKRRGADQEVTT